MIAFFLQSKPGLKYVIMTETSSSDVFPHSTRNEHVGIEVKIASWDRIQATSASVILLSIFSHTPAYVRVQSRSHSYVLSHMCHSFLPTLIHAHTPARADARIFTGE